MARKAPLLFRSLGQSAMVAVVQQFYSRHGHFDFINVRGYEGDSTGYYAVRLRYLRDNGLIKESALAALEAIDFPWDGYSYRWQRMCGELEEYIAKERRLPHRLMTWWRRQRELDQEGQLEADRAPRLRLLPFPDPTVYHWVLRLRQIEAAMLQNKRLTKTNVRWVFDQYDLLQQEGLVKHWNRFFQPSDSVAFDLRRLVGRLHSTDATEVERLSVVSTAPTPGRPK